MLIARYVPFPLFPSTVGTVVQRSTFSSYKPDLKKNKQFNTHNHIYSFVNTQDEEKLDRVGFTGFLRERFIIITSPQQLFNVSSKKSSNVTVMIPLMTDGKFCDLLR